MAASPPQEAARARLRAIEAEVQGIRGEVPVPALKAEPLSPAGSQRLMDLFAEASIHHVVLRELEEARRAIADAIVYMQDVIDAAAVARASLLTGEALVELDSPKHAKARLQVAMAYYEKIGDMKLASRARIGLGRALILLDDLEGMVILRALQQQLLASGDAVSLARVEAFLHEATTGGDAAQTVRAGYGRAVSIPPGRF